MENTESELLHKRVANDIQAFDDAKRSLESVFDKKEVLKDFEFHGVGDKAALENLLKTLGIDDYELKDGDDLFVHFKEILASNGYTYTVVKLQGTWWRSTCVPMLGILKGSGNFTPIVQKGFFYRYINAAGESSMVTAATAGELEEYAFCFYKLLPPEKMTTMDLFLFTLKGIPKFHLWMVLVLSLLIALMSMQIPYTTKIIFDQVVPSGESRGLVALAFVLFNTALTIGLMSTLRNKVFIGIKNMMTVNSEAALFDRLYHLKPSYFRKESAGTASTQVLSVLEASEHIYEGIVTVVFTVIVSLAYLIQLFVYSHGSSIAYWLLLLLGFNLFAIWLAFVARNKVKLKWSWDLAKFNGLMFNYISGIQKIKTNGAEARAFKNWASRYKDTVVFNFVETTFPYVSTCLNLASLLLIVYIVPGTDMTVSDYAAFFSAYAGLASAVELLGMYSGDFAYILPSFRKVSPLLEEEPEKEDASKIVTDLSGSINITDLRFRYSENMPYLFESLDLNIKAGEYVAIVGPSGCGKSTLLRLMLGFETPEAGSVFYDHYNVNDVNKSSLRQHLGICLQGGTLFNGTILENVRIADPFATEDEVWEALRLAAVDDEIRNLPGGLHHELDANAQGISGGQRQRILIARSILNHPSVLFMDEATSALDNISQAKVIENLGKINCTRITIAHRLSTIRDCDRIIVLSGGQVAEQGTYDELMAMGGIFYEISQRQIL